MPLRVLQVFYWGKNNSGTGFYYLTTLGFAY